MKQPVTLGAAALVAAAVICTPLPAQQNARQYGVSAGVGVAAAPLGEVAESYGTGGIPGTEYDVRLFTRSARGNEWNVGAISDRYRVQHVIDLTTQSSFEYSSTGVLVGRYWLQRAHGVPFRLGLDLGWRWFTANSSRPDVYTGEVSSSSVRGEAALLGVSYGVEIPAGPTLVSPRLRVETNYPDFGGGDGYSAVHRENDLGFRASFGVELRRAMLRR